MNPINLAAPINASNLSPQTRAALNAIQTQQEVVLNYPYWSRVRFPTVLTGGTGAPSVYTVAAGTEVTAFGYAIKNDMAAGGRPGVQALLCDTNIQSPGETLGGQDLFIKRVGVVINTNSEIALLKQGAPELSVRLSLDGGSSVFNLAPSIVAVPGGYGLSGQQSSAIEAQPIPGGRPVDGSVSNGWPVGRNQMGIPETLLWTSKGKPDSNLNIIIRAERAFSFTTQLADEAAATGIRGYTNPPASAVFLDFTVFVQAQTRSQRSANQ